MTRRESDVTFFARVAVAAALDLLLSPLRRLVERVDAKYAGALGGDEDE